MRRTPLERRTELRRYTMLAAGRGIVRRTPLNPVSEKRKGVNYERRIVVSVMRSQSDGVCPRCRLYGLPLHGHERLNRSHGGDIVHPDVLICDPCNMAIEDAPKQACWDGWKVSPKWPHDHTLTSSQARSLTGVIVEFGIPDEVAS